MAKTGFRVTYATLTADNEELHEAYEHGVETAKSWLGQKHPFYVDGEERWGDATDEERSPIDRDVVIGHFGRATRQDAKDAIAAAKAFAPEWAATSVAGTERDHDARRGPDLRAPQRALRPDGDGGRQEPARGARRRRGDGRPHPLLHPPDGGQRRVRLRDGPAVPERAQPERPAPVRRVGRHQPVQLPDGAGRRPGRRRARRRQHRRAQAVAPGLLHGAQAVRVPARSRRAERRVPRGDRTRQHGRRRARGRARTSTA